MLPHQKCKDQKISCTSTERTGNLLTLAFLVTYYGRKFCAMCMLNLLPHRIGRFLLQSLVYRFRVLPPRLPRLLSQAEVMMHLAPAVKKAELAYLEYSEPFAKKKCDDQEIPTLPTYSNSISLLLICNFAPYEIGYCNGQMYHNRN